MARYWAIQEKLQSSYLRKNVELVIHGFLQNDLNILADLKQTSEEVLIKIALIQSRIDLRETPKTIFTLSEVRDNLREHYQDLSHDAINLR